MKIINEVAERMGVIPKLSLGIKLEGGGVQSTGPHLVTFGKAELVEGKDWKGVARREMKLNLIKDGKKCYYQFPLRGDNGKPHYLLEKLMGVEEGDERVLELKSAGAKKFIEVRLPKEVGRI